MHKQCASCKTRIPLAVGVCPFCGSRQPDPRPAVAEAETTRRTQSGRRNTQPFPGITPEDLDRLNSSPPRPRALRDHRFAAGKKPARRTAARWPLMLLGLAVLAAAGWWFMLRPRTLPTAALQPSAEGIGSPCADMSWCVVAYFAPWDPASVRSMSTLARLAATVENTDVGVAVIIGTDAPGEMQAMAEAAPVDAWLDPDGALVRAFDLELMPSWLLVDARGRVTRTVNGTYFPFEDHLHKLGLGELEPADPPPGRAAELSDEEGREG